MNVLKDVDGTYSIRRIGGFLALFLLGYLVVSFTISTKWKVEIPSAYWGAIYLIIVFYFLKDTLSNLRLNTKVDDATSNTVTSNKTDNSNITSNESTSK
jgi:hypothetical protein